MATGYGADVSLTSQLVAGRVVTGRQVVAEALYRRLITPRGSLPDDLAYGFDVSAFVGAVGYSRALPVIGGMVVNELSKDDRVINVRCEVFAEQLAAGLQSLTLSVTATLAESDEDFSLTVAVTDATASLLTSAP